MATNFPTSLDSLTNPAAGDSLSSPSHSAQHANVNDAVEALQAKVGVDGSAVTGSLDYKVANQGLTHIFEGNMSGTTYSVSNVFSSTFRNYHINIANWGESSGGSPTVNIRFRTTSDDTRAVYQYSEYGHFGITQFNNGAANQTVMTLATMSNVTLGSASFDVLNPNIAAVTGVGGTFLTYQANVSNYTLRTSRGMVATTDAYTGISFILGAAASFTGTINIYGYGQA